MSTRLLLAALALPLVLATACGSDSGRAATDPSSATPSAKSDAAQKSPQCADVWQDGTKLPGGYDGCYVGVKLLKPDGRYCEFGKPLVTYDHRFYAVRGGTIREAKQPFNQDRGYQDVLGKCSA